MFLLVPAYPGSPGQTIVCVCVCVRACVRARVCALCFELNVTVCVTDV